MAAIAQISIDLTKIDQSRVIVKGKNKYLNLDVLIRDEVNQYNQNVAVYHSQNKEEREAKETKNYVGNGKAVWSKGEIVVVSSQPKVAQTQEVTADLDF